MKLTLVAGIRAETAEFFEDGISTFRPTLPNTAVRVLYERDFDDYYRAFNRTLAHADIVWTKPSELAFYAGLGLPLILDPPVGDHEYANLRWIEEHGAGFGDVSIPGFSEWLDENLRDGSLALAGWQGFTRLESGGTEAIIAHLLSDLTSS